MGSGDPAGLCPRCLILGADVGHVDGASLRGTSNFARSFSSALQTFETFPLIHVQITRVRSVNIRRKRAFTSSLWKT